MFKKSDLKPFMLVECPYSKYVIVEYNNQLIGISDGGGWMDFYNFEEDLSCPNYSDFDIIKVWSPPYSRAALFSFDIAGRNILFDRENEKKTFTISELCKMAGVEIESVNII